jgi:hypothetical protein
MIAERRRKNPLNLKKIDPKEIFKFSNKSNQIKL